jgi:hypothetical protein
VPSGLHVGGIVSAVWCSPPLAATLHRPAHRTALRTCLPTLASQHGKPCSHIVVAGLLDRIGQSQGGAVQTRDLSPLITRPFSSTTTRSVPGDAVLRG